MRISSDHSGSVIQLAVTTERIEHPRADEPVEYGDMTTSTESGRYVISFAVCCQFLLIFRHNG